MRLQAVAGLRPAPLEGLPKDDLDAVEPAVDDVGCGQRDCGLVDQPCDAHAFGLRPSGRETDPGRVHEPRLELHPAEVDPGEDLEPRRYWSAEQLPAQGHALGKFSEKVMVIDEVATRLGQFGQVTDPFRQL